MLERAITYSDLCISPSELYEQMGYGDAVPDASVLSEIEGMTADVKPFLRPRFCFFIAEGTLDLERNTLTSCGKEFTIGRIIARQLRGSDAFAFFVATAGVMFEAFQQRLMAEGDMVKVFVADSMGSVIAEKTADCMETELQAYIADNGWKHTNRFSPGYCGWHVSQQQQLFSLFPTPAPCGVKLTDSSLMIPIKSVSGVIGLGRNVRKLEYTCGLCDFKQCYKRRKRDNS